MHGIIEGKNIMDYTLEELRALEYFYPEDKNLICRAIIVVPMEETHDSGYQCMRFVLMGEVGPKGCDMCKIVGVVGGGCDVINLNGIGGYGKRLNGGVIKDPPRIDWSIDCLPGSKCLRIFSSYDLCLDDIICSAFAIYDARTTKEDIQNGTKDDKN